jgi:2-hydroxyglutarate dehydrogenase
MIFNLDGIVSYNSTLIDIQKENNGEYTSLVKSVAGGNDEPLTAINSPIVINASGLNCRNIAEMVLNENELLGLDIKYAKGHYFSWRVPGLINRLIYPIPDENVTSLGIHLTLDLSGRVKFGPDVHFTKGVDYSFGADRSRFAEAVRKYIPSVRDEDLLPDYVGVRPKLQGPGDKLRDFHIMNHDGFVNLMGIESPGLTSSLGLAEYVNDLLYRN